MSHSELRRRCAKCNITALEGKKLSFHRFPLPGKHGLLKARVWAEFCYPNGNWLTEKSLKDLHLQHKMLCSKHFDDSSYTSSARQRLNNYAIPTGAEDLLLTFRQEQCATSSEIPDAAISDEKCQIKTDVASSPKLLEMDKKNKSDKHSHRKRKYSTSSISSTRTPSPLQITLKKVSRKDDTTTASTNNSSTLDNAIPEFDPLKDDINTWLGLIHSYSQTFAWSDEMIRYQALNKLKGSAKLRYDSLLRTEIQSPSWKWKDWSRKLSSHFQVHRNMFELLKDIIDRKPIENQSLYDFYFEQKCKIDRLSLNFSEPDIISIIIGNIGDNGIGASIKARNFVTCDSLANFLNGHTYITETVKQSNKNSRYPFS